MIPRFGSPPDRTRRYRRRPGAYALLVRDGQVLLTRQTEPLSEVQLPGGGIDPGESQIAALHREVFEETGWAIAAPRRIGAYRRFDWLPEYDLWAEKICHVWLAYPARRRGPPAEAHHRALWLPVSSLPSAVEEPAARRFLMSLSKEWAR